MKILIVAATWMEVKFLVDEFKFIEEKNHFLKEYKFADNEIDVLISGIGTTFSTYHLTTTLQQNKYQLVINAGIAGSFTHDLKIGQVVNVVSEEFADLGIENKEQFLTLFESGFMNGNDFPFENGMLKSSASNGTINWKNVHAVTANISHGEKSSISVIKEKFSAQIETMEGAAVLYVCSWFGVPVYEIRSISNYINPGELSQWNIPLALENLKNAITDILYQIAISIH